MQLMIISGSGSKSHNQHLRSLWISYPRNNHRNDIMAVLSNRRESAKKFNLPVLNANSKGIEIRLPALLSGMFYLKIEDGEHSFLREIALQ